LPIEISRFCLKGLSQHGYVLRMSSGQKTGKDPMSSRPKLNWEVFMDRRSFIKKAGVAGAGAAAATTLAAPAIAQTMPKSHMALLFGIPEGA
jgi:hypothetical protein